MNSCISAPVSGVEYYNLGLKFRRSFYRIISDFGCISSARQSPKVAPDIEVHCTMYIYVYDQSLMITNSGNR